MVLLGLVSKWIWQMELPLWYLAVIGIAANLFGQLGDLSMSLIKREAGIKDYSHIFLTTAACLTGSIRRCSLRPSCTRCCFCWRSWYDEDDHDFRLHGLHRAAGRCPSRMSWDCASPR